MYLCRRLNFCEIQWYAIGTRTFCTVICHWNTHLLYSDMPLEHALFVQWYAIGTRTFVQWYAIGTRTFVQWYAIGTRTFCTVICHWNTHCLYSDMPLEHALFDTTFLSTQIPRGNTYNLHSYTLVATTRVHYTFRLISYVNDHYIHV